MFEDVSFPFSLGSDNHAGVHPEIMNAIVAANHGHAHAYGHDQLCQLTDQEFKRVFGSNVQAEYVFTGTAANVLSLAPLISSFESIYCSSLSHIELDECGAPEKFLGSKLISLPSTDGKIYPDQCAETLARRGDQHVSQPRAVSLTLPSEMGVCYSLKELELWRKFTHDNKLWLHLDGARLANAAVHLNVSLKELTSGLGVDVVSFGGTKNGLLGAEAVLLFSNAAKTNFKYHRKQAMQLSSKTRFLAAQFYAYLKDDLWQHIARHTTHTATQLTRALSEFPEIKLPLPTQSNALFVQLPKAWIKPLREKMFFYVWDFEHNLCRWMISWDWSEEMSQKVIYNITEVKSCFPIK